MNFPFPLAAALAATLATSLAAQVPCPMQTTQHVPESISNGPTQDCSGLDIEVIEVGVRLDGNECPTWMVHTPPHDIAVPSAHQTYVEVLHTLPITMTTFQCMTRWFLFIPIGTSCAASKPTNVGYVYSMLARPCLPPQG